MKFTSAKVGLDIDESDLHKLGFGAKAPHKEHHHKHEEYKGDKKGGKKNNKLQFSADDFPTL